MPGPETDTIVEHPSAEVGVTPPNMPLDTALEAVLFSCDRPTPPKRLAEALFAAGIAPEDELTEAAIMEAVDRLNDGYERTGRAFRIEPVAGGIRVMTRPEHAPVLAAFHKNRASGRLSRPALETLAIVAYKQPITRARLEAIRGVACGEVLRSLLERRLVSVVGRAEELGRPMLYGTTRQFLDAFGLANLKDLPKAGELVGPGAAAGPFHVEPNEPVVRTESDEAEASVDPDTADQT
ncbi:MAG: SMC-Scp complex subunit ScpB [Planctomycetota bacterium]